MSMIKAFSLLKDIKPYKEGWRIQVKVIKIHCLTRKTIIQRTHSKLRLGDWRLIDTFIVSHARGQYRPTDHHL
ncbi:hypothetical protein HID58_033995 [Brassica napus]|uniref:Replication protein A 70 kDa DNA-binding subunit B/D first OB fold domain-containing protein n=1 Tax=Brassica napus TaxID=3708 RepID=A0ABQ8C0U6_BRANA|nr:hypothetical protein HID58_037087 [Brassica napus]KAH0910674.1 hypothetical protein HID58_033995 [Brassica napus]